MAIKQWGQSPILPSFDVLPTLVGPVGSQIVVSGVVYTSDGTQWNAPKGSVVDYIPLWWNSPTPATTTTTSNTGAFLRHGGVPNANKNVLHTLSPKWSATVQFALEGTIYNGTSGYTTSAQLYDITTSTLVPNTSISTSVTTASAVPVRSTGVTLNPGHDYGVSIWVSNASNTGNYCDFSLVALLA